MTRNSDTENKGPRGHSYPRLRPRCTTLLYAFSTPNPFCRKVGMHNTMASDSITVIFIVCLLLGAITFCLGTLLALGEDDEEGAVEDQDLLGRPERSSLLGRRKRRLRTWYGRSGRVRKLGTVHEAAEEEH